MVKRIKFSHRGIKRDLIDSKSPYEYYYDAYNINLNVNDSDNLGGIINERGNKHLITIPNIIINKSASTILYGTKTLNYVSNSDINTQLDAGLLIANSTDQKIINIQPTRDSLIVFTTDETMDCIWEIKDILSKDVVFTIELLYVRNMNMSINNPIQCTFNYENKNIQKIYWVDGINQIRSINIKHSNIEGNSNLIDIPLTSIDFVGNVEFSQPTIRDIVSGGSHTSGMIQYAYNLYRLNSSQTKPSPLSILNPLGKGTGQGGGALNETVSATPIVEINDIDPSFTHLIVYAIKYTSFNEIPSISVIDERELSGNTSVSIYDDGSEIRTLSLEEFTFLGSDPIIPKHIETKDNRLFISNIQTKQFILPVSLDTRAYSFASNRTTTAVYNDVKLTQFGSVTGTMLTVNSSYQVPSTHDAINTSYNLYKYQYNSNILGGEGKFIKYQILSKTASQLEGNEYDLKYFKDDEVYRLGIKFYNMLGQTSLPSWIADFQAPEGNLEGNYNTLKVTFKPEFYVWLNTIPIEERPIGYKILRAERQEKDKTIICQGIVNPMMVNYPETDAGNSSIDVRTEKADSVFKMPNFLMRTFANVVPLQPTKHLTFMQFENNNPEFRSNVNKTTNPLTEIGYDGSEARGMSFQHTVMQQLYSPEILFNNLNFSGGLLAKVKGGAINTKNSVWIQERNIVTTIAETEAKVTNQLTVFAPGANTITIKGRASDTLNRGLIANTNDGNKEELADFLQFYREYKGFKNSLSDNSYAIYNKPEITERGQGRALYNNDGRYEYANSLEGLISDGNDEYRDDQGPSISVNSWGAKCATFVLGTNSNTETRNRRKLEDMYSSAGINNTSTSLIMEFVKPDSDKYLGNIYGGNSYEDKKRTNYIEIGKYANIETNVLQIDSPGDTFVNYFKFTRIAKTDTELYQFNVNQVTEIVEFKVETTIDLKNRNDISFSSWDSKFQPRYDDYHKYNRVYSQESNLLVDTDTDFNFKRINNFDTRIQSSKLKIPNETIDSFTDILVNETLHLDGKYGPINGMVNFNDTIFALQDMAVAYISINPRVVINAQDGIATELGTGQVLDNYKYITTQSGSINKWSIIATTTGFYYFDALNKTWIKFQGQIISLGDKFGLVTHFRNTTDFETIKKDNPLLKTGVSTGYDPINDNVYLTLLQGDKSYTLSFNERLQTFASFHSYIPSIYTNKGYKMISTNPDIKELFEHNVGDYNVYYGINHPSYITYLMNPQERYCSFDNIIYNSEANNNGKDLPNFTFSKVKAWNEYSETREVALIKGKNLQRKNRVWRFNIPRLVLNGNNTIDRMKGNDMFMKLTLENEYNNKMILDDLELNYTVYNE